MHNTNTITIGGKKHPIKFTYTSLHQLEQLLGKPFSEIAQQMTQGGISSMLHIAYVGLKDGARIAKKDFNMTIEEVGDILTPDLMEEIAGHFGDAFAPQGESKAPEEDGKKK